MPEHEKHSGEKDPEIAALQKQHQGKAFDRALLETAKGTDVRKLQDRIWTEVQELKDHVRKLEAHWSSLKDHLYEASTIGSDDLHEMVDALTKDCVEARVAKSDALAVVEAAKNYLEAKDEYQGVQFAAEIQLTAERYRKALSLLRKALEGYMT